MFRLLPILLLLLVTRLGAQPSPRPMSDGAGTGPRVLVFIAHPDDETAFTGVMYKVTHDLGGSVDMALVTNGEGGYKYSTLAESYYGLELTDEAIGRRHLPAIRKKETMNAGAIVGVRNYFFFDEQDHMYTLNVDSTLRYVWNVASVKARLAEILRKESYDYMLVRLPTPATHGHHKGATILALQTVRDLPAGVKRPIVLAGASVRKNDTDEVRFGALSGYPETNVSDGTFSWTFDRTQKFGYRNRLDYRIIANWAIAEHKSQGTLQLSMNDDELERYWYFDINPRNSRPAVDALFERMKVVTFKAPDYR